MKFNHGPIQKLDTENIRLIEGEKRSKYREKKRSRTHTSTTPMVSLQSSLAPTLLGPRIAQATSLLSVEGEQRGGLLLVPAARLEVQ
jgi:hypothetical protein